MATRKITIQRPPKPATPPPARAITFYGGGGGAQTDSNRYGENLSLVYDALHAACNAIILGDSTSSVESHERLWEGIMLEWAVPNGWAGFFAPVTLASTGALQDFAGTYTGAESWPAVGALPNEFSPTGDCIYTKTSPIVGNEGFDTFFCDATWNELPVSSPYDGSQALVGGSITPSIIGHVLRISCSTTNWAFTEIASVNLGPQGICQAGTVWAAGDWLTGATDLRVGFVYEPTANTLTDTLTFQSVEGFQNAEVQSGVSQTFTLSATANNPRKPNINWRTISAAAASTPWGSPSNGPGYSQNPIFMQKDGLGTVNPGDPQTSADIVAAGNANWTGNYRLRWLLNSSTATANKEIIYYGTMVERTSVTTGFFMYPISFAGWSVVDLVTEATQTQLANTFVLNPDRPVNLVISGLGFNYSNDEFNGTTYSKENYKINRRSWLDRVNSAADEAGIERPIILFWSQWQAHNSATNGLRSDAAAGGSDLQSEALRELAQEYPNQIAFFDFNLLVQDRYPNILARYQNTRNVNLNLWGDALHQSLRGNRLLARTMFEAIMAAGS